MAKIIGKGSFGATGTLNLTQSVSKTKTSDSAELRTKDGEYAGVVFYADREEYSIEVAVGDGGEIPAVGDEDWNGFSGVVTNVQESESNSSFKTFSVSITDYHIKKN